MNKKVKYDNSIKSDKKIITQTKTSIITTIQIKSLPSKFGKFHF